MLNKLLSDTELRALLNIPNALEMLAFLEDQAQSYGPLADWLGLDSRSYLEPLRIIESRGLIRRSDLAAHITRDGRSLLHQLRELTGIKSTSEKAAVQAMRTELLKQLKR